MAKKKSAKKKRPITTKAPAGKRPAAKARPSKQAKATRLASTVAAATQREAAVIACEDGDSSATLAVAIRSIAEAMPRANAEAIKKVLSEWGVSANPFQVSMILKRVQADSAVTVPSSPRRRDEMLALAKAKFVRPSGPASDVSRPRVVASTSQKRAMAVLSRAQAWPDIAAGLASLSKATTPAAPDSALWDLLIGEGAIPKNPTRFESDDDVWARALERISERLHPDADVAAKISAVVFAATNGNIAQLKSLDITAPRLVDLQPFACFRELEFFRLDQSEEGYFGGGNLCDIEPLAKLKRLREVLLFWCSFEDLTPLTRLPVLSQLNLAYCDSVSDLSPLAKCKSLRSLYLDCCGGVQDISPLAQCRWLKSLTLVSLAGVEDLSSLASFRGKLNLEDMDHASGS